MMLNPSDRIKLGKNPLSCQTPCTKQHKHLVNYLIIKNMENTTTQLPEMAASNSFAQKVTKEALAELLHGREYPFKLTTEERQLAKASNLVVVYGLSDDLMEFDGAMYEEVGCYEGGTASLNKEGLCKKKHRTAKIKALGCETMEYSFTYKTKLPHAVFDVLDDDDKYCRGIVFSMSDIPETM